MTGRNLTFPRCTLTCADPNRCSIPRVTCRDSIALLEISASKDMKMSSGAAAKGMASIEIKENKL